MGGCVLTHSACNSYGIIWTPSYYHHQIGSMNHFPLSRVRSWNKDISAEIKAWLSNCIHGIPGAPFTNTASKKSPRNSADGLHSFVSAQKLLIKHQISFNAMRQGNRYYWWNTCTCYEAQIKHWLKYLFAIRTIGDKVQYHYMAWQLITDINFYLWNVSLLKWRS